MGDLRRVEEEKQREVARTLARGMSPQEKAALAAYVDTLYRIRVSAAHPMAKTKDAWAATVSSEIVWPVVRTILEEIKRHAWDERGTKGRAGIATSVAALAVFGPQGAGIAALGGAIGVPLWLVFGAGGAFLAGLYEELHGKKPPDGPPPAPGVVAPPVAPSPARPAPMADVIDVQAKPVLDRAPPRIAVRPPRPERNTLAIGDSIDCAACGHSRTVTQHWLGELAKNRSDLFLPGRLELAQASIGRLKCSSCGSKNLDIRQGGGTP